MSLFSELKRRNVFRVAIAYVIAAWLVLQVSELVLDAIEAPAWVLKALLLLAALGLPIVLLFSWAYELTPDGLKKEQDLEEEMQSKLMEALAMKKEKLDDKQALMTSLANPCQPLF